MLNESRHLERLVNDLLELSRLQDAGFQLCKEEINLCNVVSDAVRAIRPAAQAKHIVIEATVPKMECLLSGDYGRIRQLLFILLDNAVKFSPEGGAIQINLAKTEGCTLSVTDHGVGIPQEDLPHIFDRFYKTNSKENKNGTGLGLAIASEIVKRHNARISAQNGEDGTSFQVVFP
ncbi:Sensor histidine kinase ResE [bioreactor metagenome]|uniref:histidine kinase n=1 Tax=bioreactor metagenome TaxID=1076179 RepID=A0A645BMM8_9ZZZZ